MTAEIFMRRAIALSLEQAQSGAGGPFGAVIVKDGRIIAEGANRVTTTCDPTAHAEIVAIRNACAALHDFSLAGCEIYTSCEPCPMCLAAIYWARIGFDDAFLYDEIPRALDQRTIPTGQVLAEEAIAAFTAWEEKPDKVRY